MKYAFVFALFGLYLAALACILGGLGLLLLWPGISILVLAAAYAGLGPGLYGKRPDGRMAWWAVLLLLPYLLLTWASWHIQRLLSREPCCNEVAPGLWIGRRVFAGELPGGVSLIDYEAVGESSLFATFLPPNFPAEQRRWLAGGPGGGNERPWSPHGCGEICGTDA